LYDRESDCSPPYALVALEGAPTPLIERLKAVAEAAKLFRTERSSDPAGSEASRPCGGLLSCARRDLEALPLTVDLLEEDDLTDDDGDLPDWLGSDSVVVIPENVELSPGDSEWHGTRATLSIYADENIAIDVEGEFHTDYLSLALLLGK
jgi:hypothetical protein